MITEYQIIEHGIVIGRFEMDHHRDIAFQDQFMNRGRMAYKKDIKKDQFGKLI